MAKKQTGRKFPRHLKSNPREWRQIKRQQWRIVIKALADFNYGSAYTPSSHDLHELIRRADAISEDMKGNWIAW